MKAWSGHYVTAGLCERHLNTTGGAELDYWIERTAFIWLQTSKNKIETHEGCDCIRQVSEGFVKTKLISQAVMLLP